MSKTTDAVVIHDWKPEYAEDFKRINAEWIETMFTMEPVDQAILDDPQGRLIDPGGRIWMVSHPQLGMIGACALRKAQDGWYELTKMGVSESARGLGVGRILLDHAIEEARIMQVKTLYLLTNHRCEAAIHLYEKVGFVHDEEIKALCSGGYERCDVTMRYMR